MPDAPPRRVLPATGLALLVLLLVPAQALAQGTGGSTPAIDRVTGNVSVVDHLPYTMGTDLYFQRRDGRQRLDGRTVDTTRELLFAGADASVASDLQAPSGGAGLRILDVTDPRAIRGLAAIRCTGFHADVAVYENLLLQAIDDAGSNGGCAPGLDPRGVDREGVAGVRILDVTDPTAPTVVGFVDEEMLGGGVHNISVVPDEGLAYLASSDLESVQPRFGWIDLTRPDFPARVIPMREITPTATGGCHDIGLDVVHDRAFCAALTQTHIWDISNPRMPRDVSSIVNPAISLHHGARLAPDGETLVLNDELTGAAAAFGCLGTGSLGAVGALWFYDISDPAVPVLQGSYSTEELNPTDDSCTSHFYNFVPGTSLVSVGWYRSGMVLVDFTDPTLPSTAAVLEPSGTNFWASYHHRGLLYGSSFRRAPGDDAPGLWVASVDGLPDRAPSPYDEGTTWSRWTPPGDGSGGGAGGGPDQGTAGRPGGDADVAAGAASDQGLPRTGGGALALGTVGLAVALGAGRTRRR